MRILLWLLFAIIAALAFMYAYGCLVLSTPRWTGPAGDNFDGRIFRNVPDVEHRGFGEFLKWRLTREPRPWVYRHRDPAEPPSETIPPGSIRATHVGHATVLIQAHGLNILTDPIWSDRAGPFSWAGVRRFEPPGIRFDDLPRIDAVLVSHNHYDHMDIPTLRMIVKRFNPKIYTTLGNAHFLKSSGIPGAVEMDWWQEAKLAEGVVLTALPARHFSARGLCDRDRSLWASFAIDGPSGLVFFAGDTGFGAQFEEARTRLGAPRLALLPIGSYKPGWFMAPVHLSPDEAVEAFGILEAERAMAIHFNTFPLGDDAQDEAAEALAAAIEKAQIPPEGFVAPSPGTVLDIGPPEVSD